MERTLIDHIPYEVLRHKPVGKSSVGGDEKITFEDKTAIVPLDPGNTRRR